MEHDDQDRNAALGCFAAFGIIVASLALWTAIFYTVMFIGRFTRWLIRLV